MRRRRCIKKSGWGARGEGAAPPPAKHSMFLDRRRWTQKEVEREREERRSPPLQEEAPPLLQEAPSPLLLGGGLPRTEDFPSKKLSLEEATPPLEEGGDPYPIGAVSIRYRPSSSGSTSAVVGISAKNPRWKSWLVQKNEGYLAESSR